MIDRELERYLPFLSTTKLLIAAVKAGAGREVAHEVIKEHAVAVALEMRQSGRTENDLLARLATDDRFPVNLDELGDAISNPLELAGRAGDQVDAITGRVAMLLKNDPDAAAYRPGEIL